LIGFGWNGRQLSYQPNTDRVLPGDSESVTLMKRLLIVTELIELGAGVALLYCPSVVVALLLGSKRH
jgi:hypothetical protein